jgi:hypothetical protein
MRRILFVLILVPLVTVSLTAVYALVRLHEPAADFDVRTPIASDKEEGRPDDILLEDPQPFALAIGSWLTKIQLPLPDDKQIEQLAKTNPIAFLKYCIRRADYSVKGYDLTLKKQERIGGKLQPSETIAVKFREYPFAVLMEWLKGERLAKKTLYARGENNNMLLVKPAGVLAVAGIVEREPEGEQAKQSGRYPLTEFGIKIGMLRLLSSWEAGRKSNTLKIEYVGVKKIKEAGDRDCYVFKRPDYGKPEEDGIQSGTFYIDKETWLQVGITLKNKEGDLLADYWFTDIKLNPEFKPEAFTRKALK